MENRIEQYQEIKKNDGVLTVAESNFGAQSTDQDPDCWSDLWQCMKAKGSRFFRKESI